MLIAHINEKFLKHCLWYTLASLVGIQLYVVHVPRLA